MTNNLINNLINNLNKTIKAFNKLDFIKKLLVLFLILVFSFIILNNFNNLSDHNIFENFEDSNETGSNKNNFIIKADNKIFDIDPFIKLTGTLEGEPFEIWNDRPGIVVFDYDRDNDQDIYVTSEQGHPNKLYQNNAFFN